MGIKIAGIDVSGIIKKEIGDNVLQDPAHSVILHKITPGTRTGNLTGGTNPTTADKTCKGFIDVQRRDKIGGTLVEAGNVIIILIGDSIQDGAVPTVSDEVTVEGKRYDILNLDRDPAAATYTLLCNAD